MAPCRQLQAAAATEATAEAASTTSNSDLFAGMVVPRADSSVKVGQLAEHLEPFIDLFAGQLLQPLRSEALHRKRSHHAAVEHRPPEHSRGQLLLRRQVAEEPAGEAISGAR